MFVDLKDEMLGPLLKKLNMSKFNMEKEDLKMQIASVRRICRRWIIFLGAPTYLGKIRLGSVKKIAR